MEPKKGTAIYYGDGKTRYQWTTFADAAAYTVSIVTSENAEQGGTYSIMPDSGDVFYMAKTWTEVTRKDIRLFPTGRCATVERICNVWDEGTSAK